MSSIGAGGGSRPCQFILQQCLAVTLRKAGTTSHDPGEFWMYDSGYLLFQSFLSSNAKCWWNTGLVAACRQLRYAGYVQGGVLLVGSRDACALELLRAAYARAVLKPPDGHIIQSLGDLEDCIVTPCPQGQFTPLPEALCDVIMELTNSGVDAGVEAIRRTLSDRFPHVQKPNHETVYDTLAQLTAERKIYHTSKGYFIVTPERRRSRSHSHSRCTASNRSTPSHHASEFANIDGIHGDEQLCSAEARRRLLLSQDELLVIAHGDMATLRDGHVTHQCVQTSLRDVICGGSPSDKIIYPSSTKRRSASFPIEPRSDSPERRRSTSIGRTGGGVSGLRLWGSARRLRRSASTRSLARDRHHAPVISTDSSSGAESNCSPKKTSLLSRLFRRSTKRSQAPLGTFAAQFPPTEWFNSAAIHLHSIGTQTCSADMERAQQEYYNYENNSSIAEVETVSNTHRSSTLPRRTNHHRRHLSNESTAINSCIESRDDSPKEMRHSPVTIRNYNTNTLPRSPNHKSRILTRTKVESSNDRLESKHSLSPSSNNKTSPKVNRESPSSKSQIKSTDSNSQRSLTKHTENIRTSSPKTVIDNKNRSLRQNLRNDEIRHSAEYRSMRDSIEKKNRYSLENRSVRDSKISSLDKRIKSSYERSKVASSNHIDTDKTGQILNESAKITNDNPHLENGKEDTNHSSSDLFSIPQQFNIKGNSSMSTFLSDSSITDSNSHSNDLIDSGACSGPSSLESHKTFSNQANSSQIPVTSGPSSLESQKTVIAKGDASNKQLKSKDNLSAKTSSSKNKVKAESNSASKSKKSITKSNSFTLQVTTHQNGLSVSNFNTEPTNNTTTTATINGANTKIYVQNSPVRSVITFENGQPRDNTNYMIINNDSEHDTKSVSSDDAVHAIKKHNEKSFKNVNNLTGATCDTNLLNNSNAALNDFESTMNNSRKMSLQLTPKDSLSYKNVLRNVQPSTLSNQNSSNPASPVINFTDFRKNSYSSNPPSPTKSYDGFGGSIGNVYYEKNSPAEFKSARHSLDHSKIYQNGFSLESSTNSMNKIQEKNTLGSEPNLCHDKFLQDRDKTLTRDNVDLYNFPSLSDLSFNFTSLAAQKILKGVSINSVDTLVELNMAANNAEKQNNCDVQHTDFGMV